MWAATVTTTHRVIYTKLKATTTTKPSTDKGRIKWTHNKESTNDATHHATQPAVTLTKKEPPQTPDIMPQYYDHTTSDFGRVNNTLTFLK